MCGDMEKAKVSSSTAGSYSQASMLCSKEDWFHGELTRDEAERALKASGSDCFLIRQSQGILVLSLIQGGETLHTKIEYGPGWYKLEGASQTFSELQELVHHHFSVPINNRFHVLGVACEKMLNTKHAGRAF